MESGKMKIVYVKVKDPIAWKQSDSIWYEEDKEFLVLNIIRTAGILIHEDDEKIVLAEVSIAADNQKLDEIGARFPQFRDVVVIAKSCIIDRQDFELKGENQSCPA